MWWRSGPDANKTRPHLFFFCISNHNLILNSYGDTHHSSWTKRTSFVMRTGTTKRSTTLEICSISKIRKSLKLLRFFLGSLEARAPPWWNPPINQSCHLRVSDPSNNQPQPQIKLHSSCWSWRIPAAHCCLPGGTRSLYGSPPLTMLFMLLWCLWLWSQAPSHSVFGIINVDLLLHISTHRRPSCPIVGPWAAPSPWRVCWWQSRSAGAQRRTEQTSFTASRWCAWVWQGWQIAMWIVRALMIGPP